jgi:hypothetical protein
MITPVLPIIRCLPVVFFALFAAPPGFAGPADVVGVKVEKSAAGVYSFAVTVTHSDKGWKHYADAWEVVGPKGEVLGTRVLAHPHVNEQPFTRSLAGVGIPDGVATVRLRAHDKVHGFGGAEIEVKVPR